MDASKAWVVLTRIVLAAGCEVPELQITAIDFLGNTPLNYAVEQRRFKVAKFLTENRAYANVVNRKVGSSQ